MFLDRQGRPFVVASQTVPILAIAPMVVIWLGGKGLPIWVPVAVIAASPALGTIHHTLLTVEAVRAVTEGVVRMRDWSGGDAAEMLFACAEAEAAAVGMKEAGT